MTEGWLPTSLAPLMLTPALQQCESLWDFFLQSLNWAWLWRYGVGKRLFACLLFTTQALTLKVKLSDKWKNLMPQQPIGKRGLPFPHTGGDGKHSGVFGRQRWSGEPCPIVPQAHNIAGIGHWRCPEGRLALCWAGDLLSGRSPWPLGLSGPSTHVSRVIGPLLLLFTSPPLLPLLKRRKKRERDSEKRWEEGRKTERRKWKGGERKSLKWEE